MSESKISLLPVSLSAQHKEDDGLDYWQGHLEDWRHSGLKQAEYCRRHNLSYWNFRKWKDRLINHYQPQSSVKLVELRQDLTSNVNAQSPSFKSDSRGYYANHSPSGIRFWCGEFCIEVDVEFSSESLSQLIRTLERLKGIKSNNGECHGYREKEKEMKKEEVRSKAYMLRVKE